MFLRIKNINLQSLASHIILTMAYPVVKTYVSAGRRLLVFTDSITIVGIVLLVCGVFYTLVLHGDFDIAGFALQRGKRSGSGQTFDSYMAGKKEKREEAFNYPLFIGILYLAAAAVLAYGFF